MDPFNPYQPPEALGSAVSLPLPNERASSRRALAISIFATTILGSLSLVYFAEFIKQFNPPVGIVLIVATFVVSIASAVLTRDTVFAPLCCLGGMMSGVTLAAMIHGWRYVTLEVTIPLTLVASIPALAIAFVRSRRLAKKLQAHQNAGA